MGEDGRPKISAGEQIGAADHDPRVAAIENTSRTFIVVPEPEEHGTLCHGRDVFDGKMMPDKATSGTI
jgi:hypothetical protein